jgi:hypothetical protein
MSNFIMKTIDDVKEKVKLLNTLKDVSVTAKLSKGSDNKSLSLVDQ